MNTKQLQYNEIVERIYNLPLEIKKEIINLLENNIADERRDEIAENIRISKKKEKENELKFSSDINELKKTI